MNIFPQISGSIIDYDILVMGHLKWNRYFNESPEDPPRGDPSTCTSVLIRGFDKCGEEYVLIIDPTLRVSPEDYHFDINRRTGLRPHEITHLFCTHHHGDHIEGLNYFKNAKWCTSNEVIRDLKGTGAIDSSRLIPVEGEFLPGIYALSLPGHTDNLHGIAFGHRGKKIIVASDAVMTKDHYEHNATEFQPDPEMNEVAAQTIINIKESFDLVIPGHDNIIVN